MDFTKSLIVFTLTNVVVFLLASMVPGNYFVFGNVVSNPTTALVYTSVLVALAVSLVGKAAQVYDLKYSETAWMLIYLAVNVGVLYLLARTDVSEVVGVGISQFWVAIAVGVVVNFAQYAAWKAFLDRKKK